MLAVQNVQMNNPSEDCEKESSSVSPVAVTTSSIEIIAQSEYETQYFGFTSKSLTDGLYNAVVEYVSEGLESLSKVMQCKLNQMSESEIRDAFDAFREELQRDFSKAFDKLEGYFAQNIFKIPPDVLLEEDQLWNEYPSASPAEVEKLNGEIENRKKKLIGNRYVSTRLRQELADTEAEVENLRRIVVEQTAMFASHKRISDEREVLNELIESQSLLSLE